MTQTSELLHSPSLQGRANKSRGKVPVTSFLQPGGGLRRGRQRFPGKHREELQTRLLAAQKDGAQGGELASHADPGRPLPSIYALRGPSQGGLGCPGAVLSPGAKQPPQGRDTSQDLRRPASLLHPQRPRARPAPPSLKEPRIPPRASRRAPAAGRAPGSRHSPARWIPGQF